MNFIVIGQSAVNVFLIVEIRKVSNNNFTVFLCDGRNYTGLSRSVISPILAVTNLGEVI